jgi:hypothetical protein
LFCEEGGSRNFLKLRSLAKNSADLDVTFVLSTELQVTIPAEELKDFSSRYAKSTPLMLSVTNDPFHFSAPIAVRVLPYDGLSQSPIFLFWNSLASTFA